MTYHSDSKRLTFLKETAHSPECLVQVLGSYTTACPIDYSLHAGIGIGAEQAECLHFFLMHSFEGYGQKVTCCFYNVFSDVIFDPRVLQCFRVSENSPSASMSCCSDDLAQLLTCLYF